ncbi:MAG: hypothetical protein R8M45_00110 [Ghiorsea sp.]
MSKAKIKVNLPKDVQEEITKRLKRGEVFGEIQTSLKGRISKLPRAEMQKLKDKISAPSVGFLGMTVWNEV